ncbi:MAG: hypothetical protein ACM3X5_04225 [Bacillota bacterium]
MNRMTFLALGAAVAASMSLCAVAANSPLPQNDPVRVAANNDYKASMTKAKADRKAAYAECAKAAERPAERSCRNQAAATYKSAVADARAAYRKALGSVEMSKK